MSHSPHPSPRRSARQLKLDKPETAKRGSAANGDVREEARHAMIAREAYYIAERRGFESGHELDDWLLAERCIDAAIADG